MKKRIINLEKSQIKQGKTSVLKDVDFKVDEGEFVFVVGRVGSGKSSLLKTIYLDLPFSGKAGNVVGYDLLNIKRREIPFLRRKLGVVFQDFRLLKDMTVRENLEFALKATGWKQKRAIDDRIVEVLDMVELKGIEGKKPHKLSGGEQQRVVIARALLNNPRLILADEPTGNLDPESSLSLMKLLVKLNTPARAIVMVTHDYSLIERFPARKLTCIDGELIESLA